MDVFHQVLRGGFRRAGQRLEAGFRVRIITPPKDAAVAALTHRAGVGETIGCMERAEVRGEHPMNGHVQGRFVLWIGWVAGAIRAQRQSGSGSSSRRV